MTPPLVSIGITTYNAMDSVAKAIQSALAQTWPNFEIIIVDDCSYDKTYTYLESIAKEHATIKVFQNAQNGGVAVARNRILEEASGEFICFFDDDDISTPDRVFIQLERLMEYERKVEGPVVCHSARKVLYPDGAKRILGTMGEDLRKPVPQGMAVAERVILGKKLEGAYGACPTCSQMARKSTYKLVGMFDPELRRGEDTDFAVRIAKQGGHFVGVSKPLVIQHMTLTSDKSLRDEYHFNVLLLNKHRDVADKHGLYDFCRKWIDLKHFWLAGDKLPFALVALKILSRHPITFLNRLLLALPNLGLNRAFARFHKGQAS